jgi:hypothetical protein
MASFATFRRTQADQPNYAIDAAMSHFAPAGDAMMGI